jgi:2-methylisocitrate lyase-like PEP mutase family enzyme
VRGIRKTASRSGGRLLLAPGAAPAPSHRPRHLRYRLRPVPGTGSSTSVDERRARFRRLHEDGIFTMPNAWDAGSARILAALGFPALATTSGGLAWSLGRSDYRVGRDELVEHVAALAAATGLPLSVDSERCFADDAAGVAGTVRLLADAGAAGCSIEDFDPATGRIDPVGAAAERVAVAAGAAREHGLVLTARAENHLHGVGDLDDTLARLHAYRAAGADVVYAPGLRDAGQIAAVVDEVDAPVNVLLLPGCPPAPELGAMGVRRVSTGSALASVAYAALAAAARELATDGGAAYVTRGLTPADRAAAFGG